ELHSMISTGELRKGVAIELDGELWQILDYHHIKMGRGSAQVRITLRKIKRGQPVERSFQAGTKWPRASMEKRPVQFLYRDGHDRDRPRRHGSDLRRGGRHDPRRHTHGRVPDPRLTRPARPPGGVATALAWGASSSSRCPNDNKRRANRRWASRLVRSADGCR